MVDSSNFDHINMSFICLVAAAIAQNLTINSFIELPILAGVSQGVKISDLDFINNTISTLDYSVRATGFKTCYTSAS